jgi:lupus La protein
MSESKVEPTEASTNPTTDGPKNNENGDAKAAAESNETALDSNTDQEKGAEVTGQPEKKHEQSGARTYDNGMLKTSATIQYDHGSRNSKYDPSVLRTSDNPKEIRGQVRICKLVKTTLATNTLRSG